MSFRSLASASLFVVATGSATAMAQAKSLRLDTSKAKYAKWTVEEVVDGQVKKAAPVYNGTAIWGKVESITIPFTDCDGYWRAKRIFHIPTSATGLSLTITGLGVDDRAVVELNGTQITSVGTTSNGAGYMQLHNDHGKQRNAPYNFQFVAGKVSLTDTTHLKPGRNLLKVIVNNTDEGIQGKIVPPSKNDTTGFGIAATVTYTE
ncbi:MAG TPA: hypothetical protein VMB71_04910 [Acetobacteraceae bacterium]|nr:hypothetical protein [Acetobacteraceae bacterium]